MPRRRGSANSAARRTVTADDARCNGNKRGSSPAATQQPTKTAKGIPRDAVVVGALPTGATQAANPPPAPPMINKLQDGFPPIADGNATATAASDLGYLHKKFKKVAATFTAESSEPSPPAPVELATPAPRTPPPADDAKHDTVLLVTNADNPAKNATTTTTTTAAAAKSGGGRYVCPYCQHACAKPSVLEKHIRAHTNERPYPCVPCGFAFKTKSNLYKHCKSRTHVLKVEETGQAPSAVDPAEGGGGSDDTSENDENAPMDDSDDGEPIVVPSVEEPQTSTAAAAAAEQPPPSSSPDKFKTPYKPKFHNMKPNEDDGAPQMTPVAETAEGAPVPVSRPSPGFLQERISQIISQNQAIVETMDPIWPRRYVRQSSRDKEQCAGGTVARPLPAARTKSSSRERSCSLTVEPVQTVQEKPAAPPPTPLSNPAVKIVQEEDTLRKRSYSEGPGDSLRHSVRNMLHKRNDTHPQNPEGSIIKDILLKSRGLLPDEPAPSTSASSSASSSSFSVSAILSRPISDASIGAETDEESQAKRARLSPASCESGRRKTALFGGEVEIVEGHQRTVLRIDPYGSSDETEPSTSSKAPPHVPGIPGPYSSGNVIYAPPAKVPVITVHPPDERAPEDEEKGSKFLRPSSLSLQPGTFNLKKTNMTGLDVNGQPNLCVSGPGMTLVSPETPRPKKLIRQLYLNGHAYTYLGLKCSTRVYFCCLSKAQPMYVAHQPKLSMYSQWTTRPIEPGSPVESMGLYDSRQRPNATSVAHSNDSHRMILTHSSYWTNRDRPTAANVKIEELDDRSPAKKDERTADEAPKAAAETARPPAQQQQQQPQQQQQQQPKRIKIFAGGYKSTEEYTYVRGRGRGRYVCEECGIRCKKPSMLKKHIRTHTDLRPYTCRQCNFSFKTKGNLTKHMKSKAHHKKCTELGIVPVPTSVDDANIDEESLARQESMKKLAGGSAGSGNEGESDVDDDEDDDELDDDDEDDDELDDEEENQESGQFDDATEKQQALGEREQEVARSLLDLGVMAPAGLAKPTTYPYASRLEESEPIEIKEEAPVSPAKAVDLSNPSPASIYGSKVASEAARMSPEDEVPASGMLQAYLTEKAMKEGQMKRSQAKLPPSAIVAEARPVDHHLQQATSARGPAPAAVPSGPVAAAAAAIASSAIAAAAMSGSAPAAPVTYRLTDDGKTACSICNKVFTKPSQLRLHINIHYFERPFRCEACAVSFRTKGHLQKHKRSVTHFNKVNMNLTFGTPSTENPRPFKCSDCMIAFRIHGHLAKHLRSKMHIMKLECLGKLPFGTYAEMERSGVNLNEIDTTDCHNSLESLQSLAHRLYKQDPSKIQQWQQEAQVASRERTVSCSSEEFSDVADEELDEDGDESDGLPDDALRQQQQQQQQQQRRVETLEPASAQMPPPKVSPQPPVEKPTPAPTLYCSACGDSFTSNESFHAHVLEKHRPVPNHASFPARPDVRSPSPIKSSASASEYSRPQIVEVRRESPTRPSEPSRPVQWNQHGPELAYPPQPPQMYYPHPGSLPVWSGRPPPKFGEFVPLNHPMAAVPPHWHQEPAAMAWRHLMLPLTMGGSLPAPGFPSAPAVPGYATNGPLRSTRHLSPVPPASAGPSEEGALVACEICGKSLANKDQLRQHMMSHAQPRPFVCEFCDAGFTTQKHLEAHVVLHRPRTS